MNTLHAKAYRFADGLPWILLFLYGYFVTHDPWIITIGFVGLVRRFFVGWEHPPPTVEELGRRASERGTKETRT